MRSFPQTQWCIGLSRRDTISARRSNPLVVLRMSPSKRQAEEQKRLMKEAIKEAAREWLDDKFVAVGKWSLYGGAALLLTAILHLIVMLDPKIVPDALLGPLMRHAHVSP